MRRQLFIFALIILLPIVSQGQVVKYQWQRVRIDSTFGNDPKIDKIIDNYNSRMDGIMDIVGYSSEEISKGYPESALSNFAADMMLHATTPYISKDYIYLSLTNFGGIRADFPQGPIRVYDIISVFPFDNKLVVVDIEGKDLQKMFDSGARNRNFQALGNIEFVIRDGKFVKCNVGGKPIDPDKIYKLVTIDFLLDGGDRISVRNLAKDIEFLDIYMRDAAVDYMKYLNQKGVTLTNKGDKRIVYE